MADDKSWDFDTYDWIERYTERMRAAERVAYDKTLGLLPVLTRAQPGEGVLDLGTGTGNSAVPFVEAGCTVLGLDPSEQMLRRGEENVTRYAPHLTLRHLDDCFLALPLNDLRFDIIIAAYAIHHLDPEAQRRAVQGMRRSLRPGGRIAVADTMFRDAAHKTQMLALDRGLEDEYQPLLDAFPAMIEKEGFRVSLEQTAPLVWIVLGE